jgi:ethanolamine utilization cobalamin adenosyltransferase
MREELTRAEQVEVAVSSPTTDYRPSNKELLREYEIRIRFLGRGCIVSVGCQEIAFESVETAMQELNEYVKNPYETQKKWRKILY